ncbi:hypothetical protein [Engelhardtia mirabilis]|uniref:Arabinogalactan endo-beta-1,4-galactanase n=1 Tax=Engelhardtia mirabilis TaxID=2528011 RepID=A0A518BGI5_9BACT|nr:hypothetical protein Pla133_11420 [Planctomycetes bacterium Pla133]QDV00403.1 hypothetical protein Pla86_11420 [Planctomycetes bacterium Pla86]
MRHFIAPAVVAAALLAPDVAAQIGLTVADPHLGTSSGLGATLDACIGSELDFQLQGPFGQVGLLAISGNPAAPGGGIPGGFPLVVDPTTAIFPVAGPFNALGHLNWSTPLPVSLPAGANLYCQGAGIEPATGALSLSNPVVLTTFLPEPGDLPLLSPGTHVGLIYSDPPLSALAVMDAAWSECLAAGVDGFELAISWSDIEVAPGIYDTTYLDTLLILLQIAGLETFLNVATIDTVNLSLPADLVDPSDPQELAPGLTWDHPLVVLRFREVLDRVAPLLVERDGFFLSVGNEVDTYLGSRPEQQVPYASFVAAAADYTHQLEPKLGVGSTVTLNALFQTPALFELLRQVGDNVPFTYYPVNGDGTVMDPSVVPGHIAAMAAAVAPRPLILQELGYPSGWQQLGGIGSSLERQRQFVENAFAAFASAGNVRFASFLQLGDWGPAELALFQLYYGITDPLFLEFLGSLGFREHFTGAPKPAYDQFLFGLAGL